MILVDKIKLWFLEQELVETLQLITVKQNQVEFSKKCRDELQQKISVLKEIIGEYHDGKA